jgi:DNA-directed RNA polymerase subunit N (RpoN/RPB10)
MIYLKCPTCGYILGNRQKIYEQGLEEIESNPNNDEEKKLELKLKLVNSLELKRYCCTMRVITYKNKTEIIK